MLGSVGALEQFGIELRLDCADADLLAVLAGIAAVEMRRSAKQSCAALHRAQGAVRLAVKEAHQAGDAIDDGGIHHLPLAARLPFEQRGKDAHRAIHRTAAEIADEVLRRHRQFATLADGIQCAGNGNVIEIVPRGLRQRTFLSPTGHAGIDEARIGFEHGIRAKAQPLHHPGAVTFDQHVGMSERFLDEGLPVLAFQVHCHTVPRAFHHRVHRLVPCPLDTDDFGAHIGEHHRRVRTRADTLEFDDLEACQRTVARHCFSLLRNSWADPAHVSPHG